PLRAQAPAIATASLGRSAMASPVGGMRGIIIADRHLAIHRGLLDAKAQATVGIRPRRLIGLIQHLRAQAKRAAAPLAPLWVSEFYRLLGDVQVQGHRGIGLAT